MVLSRTNLIDHALYGKLNNSKEKKNSSCVLTLVYHLFKQVIVHAAILEYKCIDKDSNYIAEETEKKPPINIKFEIPYFTVSGIQVRYLKIV